MSRQDGRVVATTKVVDHGPASAMLNIVLVSEGYQESELGTFAKQVNSFVKTLFATHPLNEYQCAINVYRIDVASTESGADDPKECGDKTTGSGAKPATYFDASYCAGGVRRGIQVDEGLVEEVVNARVRQWHLIIVVVNSTQLGGTGGRIAKTSVSSGWENIAIHEMGHSLFGFADEYEYYAGCGQETDRNEWPSFLGIRIEPAAPNITIWTDRNGLKWRDLVDPATPIPTTNNADCTICDPQPNPMSRGTVGTFEGAGSYHCKVYRPEFTCMMRYTGQPFCAVCQKHIRQKLAPFMAAAEATVATLPVRFTKVNDYAVSKGYVGGYPNFHEARYGLVYSTVLLRPGFAEWRDVPAEDLGNPVGLEERFRAVNDYAGSIGFPAGFPNFHEADHGQGLVYGCVFIKPGASEWRDVRRLDLVNPAGLEGRMRAVHEYAINKGFLSGFPNFHEADYGPVYGTTMIRGDYVEWRDVPAAQLGNPVGMEARFRAVNDYASANGFFAGFPNFHQADYGQGVVYGCLFIKHGAADWRDVPAAELGHPATFEARIQAVHRYARTKGYSDGFPNFHEADYGPVFGTILLKPGTVDWQDIPASDLGNPATPEARFTAVNDYAAARGYVGAFPNFHQAYYGVAYGTLLFKPEAVEWRDVSAADLGFPNDPEARFRAVNDYAGSIGFAGGFPNFHEADHGQGVVYGCIFIRPGFVDWRDVSAAELGHPPDPASRFRAVNDYAVNNGYAGGFPNFHQADHGQGVVYGCFLIKHGAVNWRDVRTADLGNPSGFEGRFRAVNDYAGNNGFAGGFPNFHERDYGIVYGTYLLKSGVAEWRDVPATDLGNPVGPEARFRAVNDYANTKGFFAGFPNFHEADYGTGKVYGCVFIKSGFADWRDVRAADLGNPQGFEARFRAVDAYASNNAYSAAFPNFHEANLNPVYGTILLKPGVADTKEVRATALGSPSDAEARFRAVNDHSGTLGYGAGFPNFHDTNEGILYGSVLIKLVAGDRRNLRAYELNYPGDAAERFRAVNDYAGANDFVGGYPNFHESDDGIVYGCVLFKAAAAKGEDVPAANLGNPVGPEARFRAVNDYAVSKGYVGGYPNFHEADHGAGTVFGCLFLNPGFAEWRDVPAAQLGDPVGMEARFRAVNDYAVANGFFAGFPNFHQADHGQGTVYGCLLIQHGAADWRDVPVRQLC